jgi:hypothetical protein
MRAGGSPRYVRGVRRKLIAVGCLAAIAVALSGVAIVARRGSTPATLTPDGPATVWSPWLGPHVLVGLRPDVLVGVRIAVGPGGRAGRVRLRVVQNVGEPGRPARMGPWFTLPAAAGVYSFPAPHVPWDDRYGAIAIDQQSGRQAIVETEACRPDADEGDDPCDDVALVEFKPALAGGISPLRARPVEDLRGHRLAITAVHEPDADGDLVGDRSEDRTDLQVRSTLERTRGERFVLTVTVHNAGPRTADLPTVTAQPTAAVAAGTWTPGCSAPRVIAVRPVSSVGHSSDRPLRCPLALLRSGETRRLRVSLTADGSLGIRVRVSAEGPDLRPADNQTRASLPR